MRPVCRVLAVSLLAAFALSGCGGGGGDGGSSSSVSTSDWADGLCSAIGDWTASVSSATTSLKGDDLSEESVKSAVDDIGNATETFVDDVKGLGKPDTEAGQKAKESLDQLANNLDDDLAEIKSAGNYFAEGVTGALAAVSAISKTLSTMSQQISSTFSELEQLDAQGELEDAFKQSDSCNDLGNKTS
jgi:cell division protein ZapA (FtsZ GTPase activity inhibitor)